MPTLSQVTPIAYDIPKKVIQSKIFSLALLLLFPIDNYFSMERSPPLRRPFILDPNLIYSKTVRKCMHRYSFENANTTWEFPSKLHVFLTNCEGLTAVV